MLSPEPFVYFVFVRDVFPSHIEARKSCSWDKSPLVLWQRHCQRGDPSSSSDLAGRDGVFRLAQEGEQLSGGE